MWMSAKPRAAAFLLTVFLLAAANVCAQEAVLDDWIAEALLNNPEIRASQYAVEAAKYRIPQSRALDDPMFGVGYQNEGFNRYTYGEMQGAQWMFSASQSLPFPGKRSLKEEMTERDSQGLEAQHEALRLKTALRMRELYFDLFFQHKSLALLQEKRALLSSIEDLALGRYAAGKAMQQEVLMAQTEKYMLLEKEEMIRQKILTLEAMVASVLGRSAPGSIGVPALRPPQGLESDRDGLIGTAVERSPEIRARIRMIEAADAKLRLAGKAYYPDFSVGASYFNRSGDFQDMWSATIGINIPIFYKSKQDMAVLEAKAGLNRAKQEAESLKLMIGAAIRDNLSMIRAAEKLMELYKNGLIPKNAQDLEFALSGYRTGGADASTAVARLKGLLDYETLYWGQYSEREKAVARIRAISGEAEQERGGK
jgi:outer membrane protein TolC